MKALIVDYGVGNILSVRRAFEAVGAEISLSADPKEILKADRLILPGVGAFGHCMEELKKRHLVDTILSYANSDRPLLGICVGMQILLTKGEEFGEQDGLNLIPGRVAHIPISDMNGLRHKTPFIGWSSLAAQKGSFLAHHLSEQYCDQKSFYFLHSFMAMPENKEHLVASYVYGAHPITAMIGRNNIIGCQFHPEKSGKDGLALIEGFLRA